MQFPIYCMQCPGMFMEGASTQSKIFLFHSRFCYTHSKHLFTKSFCIFTHFFVMFIDAISFLLITRSQTEAYASIISICICLLHPCSYYELLVCVNSLVGNYSSSDSSSCVACSFHYAMDTGVQRLTPY